ncbi:Glutamine-dependent NAD(+) synthetase [Plasmodiophora brassicae]
MATCLVKVATCNLDQWAMDFDLNLTNVRASIIEAKRQGARLRVGPELEICGYGCEDHFFEQDTFYHSWCSLRDILSSDLTDGILCDIGMPVIHVGTRYNCRVLVVNRQIVLIRPKLFLANEGNYRERRWFNAWTRVDEIDEFAVPDFIAEITGKRTVPFGAAVLRLHDTSVGIELCEELFTPESPHIAQSLNGVEIICNGSGSHQNLKKLHVRTSLIQSAMSKCGGVYLYANQQGCDGGRLYYDGCALICANGEILSQGSQFSILDVEVVTAVIDLEDIRSYRGGISSRSQQSASSKRLPWIDVNFSMRMAPPAAEFPTTPRPLSFHTVEEEIALGCSCWLWDYLRRSNASGLFLPLSGGADSASVATIVGVMCNTVMDAVHAGNYVAESDVRRLLDPSEAMPKTGHDLASRIFYTSYMGSKNSSNATRERAKAIAGEVGSYHIDLDIDSVVDSFLNVFAMATSKMPRFRSSGGTPGENLAMQNIQARVRMVFAYLMASLLPWVRNRSGFLLVLGSANVDEALRGYLTKYDCSSADINPIGGIAKRDLRRFLTWAIDHMHYDSLRKILDAPPTAELEPITNDYTQSDEQDMGMTYEELGIFGRLRNIYRCGPLSMYHKLRHLWQHLQPEMVAERVKSFFYYYSVNRHKMTTLTPSLHAEKYSPDDNRYDHRQFLYNTKWTAQFRAVDAAASQDARRS